MLRVNVQWSWKIDKCSTEGSWVPLIACKKRQEYITSLHYLCVILLRRSSCMLSTLLLFCLCRPPQRFSLPFDCWPNQIAHYILYTYSLSLTLLHFHSTPTYCLDGASTGIHSIFTHSHLGHCQFDNAQIFCFDLRRHFKLLSSFLKLCKTNQVCYEVNFCSEDLV